MNATAISQGVVMPTVTAMSKEELWRAVLGELELVISRANFTTWFRQTSITDCTNGVVVISVPNAFTRQWLEGKYHRSIVQALERLLDSQSVRVTYQLVGTPLALSGMPVAMTSVTSASPHSTAHALTASDHPAGLNPRYIFTAFIVGKANELAHAAARAVAAAPGNTRYNPLFLYGGVGLGKTHLMQAIGHEVLGQYGQGVRIRYTNAEKFTNDFIKSIREGNTEGFRERYRDVDVLMIDDIQFIAGKEQTQEEFFHTFNALHQKNKQIVLSSDRPPKSIPGLEERLTSRFGAGMIADISPPDYETRVAILETKLRERNYQIDREILEYLASQIQDNIRELEGALNKLLAQYELQRIPLSLESARSLVATFAFAPARGTISVRELIDRVAGFYEVAVEDLVSSCRKKELVNPRQIAMYLLREELDVSYPMIGNELGGRDHTTAMHAYQKVSRLVGENPRIKQEIDILRQKLYSHA